MSQAGKLGCRMKAWPWSIAYSAAAWGESNKGTKRYTRSCVPEPWPLRMESEATNWPSAFWRVMGDSTKRPT